KTAGLLLLGGARLRGAGAALYCRIKTGLKLQMKMEISKYGKITRYAALFIWIALILFLSTGNGSSEETSRIIGPI
ncbi:hypothetical protein OFB94_33890, partial [Escherichia coli]|nr:hypothetical protein [Escherichia coli]